MAKRALHIALNYAGTGNALHGCLNDARSMRKLLEPLGWVCELMLDDGSSEQLPTRANVLKRLQAFVAGARSGDKLLVSYSGHGTFVRDKNGDEPDGHDEAICMADGTLIVDDEIRKVLIDAVPAGASLVVFSDSCHSGTGGDLRFTYKDTSVCLNRGHRLPDTYVPSASEWSSRHERVVNVRQPETRGRVVFLSGCEDKQTSADTVVNNEACGAMTSAFVSAWRALSAGSATACNLRALLQHMSCSLRCDGYRQIPLLSLGNAADDAQFESGIAVLQL